MVNYAVEGDSYDKAIELAREILPQGPVALEMAKKAIDMGISKEVTAGMEIEVSSVKQCYTFRSRANTRTHAHTHTRPRPRKTQLAVHTHTHIARMHASKLCSSVNTLELALTNRNCRKHVTRKSFLQRIGSRAWRPSRRRENQCTLANKQLILKLDD